MLRTKAIAGTGLALLLILTAAPIVGSAQVFERPRRTSSSYDRSYEIGYDEGYRVGFDRGIKARQDGDSKSPQDYKEYRRADDGYNDTVGSRDSYKLGYRAGFEQGLDDGYSGQQYGGRPGVGRVQLPPGGVGGGGGPVLRRNGGGQVDNYPPVSGGGYPDPYGNGAPVPSAGPYGYPRGGAGSRVGYNTSMLIELDTPITTRYSQEGDRFSARVLEPSSYYGARVEGYIGKIKRPGKLSGKGEIVLVFQEMTFPDGSSEPMAAQVEEVIGYPRGVPRAGSRGPLSRAPWDWGKNKKDDRNDDIDAQAGDEGQIEGEGSRGRDAAVIGGSTAAGAVIGTVIGGGAGTAVGAVIGAVAGGGIVSGTRGHEIDLEPGAQLRIRTGQGTRF